MVDEDIPEWATAANLHSKWRKHFDRRNIFDLLCKF